MNGHERFWGSCYENIEPLGIGSDQGFKILLRDIVILLK